MKTFLKIVALLILAILALKLLPLTFGLVALIMGGLAGFIALGFSVVAALLGAAVVAAAVLSPIWVPVLLIVGIVALAKRSNRRPPALSA